MNSPASSLILAAGLLAATVANTATAGDVRIVAADLHTAGANRWSVNVTLMHADSGWDHYADRWRVVDDAGTVLGDRVLHHPHVDEQPFTRGLAGVVIPDATGTVYIEAHDKVHGWTRQRLTVDLHQARDGRLRVTAP
jgi:hypothetical protein